MTNCGPLAGCRVLEISHSAGAVAGRMLADLGANVIKIEPDGGEAARIDDRYAPPGEGDQPSLFWLSFNVSKGSCVVDLADTTGRQRLAAMARDADIVVTDFERISQAENDALYDLVRVSAPHIVWVEIWPYGRNVPEDGAAAGDLTLQAAGGHLYLNGDVDRPPVRLGLPVALCQGGAEAGSAALMAYYHRLRTGEGQRVDISIQECISWTMLNTSMIAQLLGTEEVRGGAVRKERANKYYTRLVWEAQDGFVTFGPVGGGGGLAREKSYSALVAWMEEDGFNNPLLTERDWNGEDQFKISQEDYDKVAGLIADFVRSKTVEELVLRSVRDRILLAPVSSVNQILESPHFQARGVFAPIADPERGTEWLYPSNWVRFDKTPLVAPTAAPRPGQDCPHTITEAAQ